MSASDVQVEIITPMQRLFYAPRKMEPEDERAALLDYVQALQGFDGVDLRVAWAWCRDNHPKTSWPVPSAFVLAALRSRRDRAPAAKAGKGAASEQNERWEMWKAVSRSPLAYEAVKRNVAWSLKCAVLHDGKKPDQISLAELVSGKHSAEKTAERIRRGEFNFTERDAATALSMWSTLLERETETQAEIRNVA